MPKQPDNSLVVSEEREFDAEIMQIKMIIKSQNDLLCEKIGARLGRYITRNNILLQKYYQSNAYQRNMRLQCKILEHDYLRSKSFSQMSKFLELELDDSTGLMCDKSLTSQEVYGVAQKCKTAELIY